MMGVAEMLTVGYIVGAVLYGIISIMLMGLFLWLSNKIFSVKNNSYWVSVLVSFVIQAASFLWLILGIALIDVIGRALVIGIVLFMMFLTWFILPWILVKAAFRTPWGKTFLVWLVWAAFYTVASIMIKIVLYLVFIMLGIGALALAMGAMA